MKTGLATLYSRRSDGKIQAWNITVLGSTFYTQSWIDPDGGCTKSEPTQCVGKQGRTAEAQAVKEATALHKKKQDEGYRADKADIDTPAFFAPMLAHVADDYMELIQRALDLREAVSLQPKLDGMRCIAQEGGGNINLTSRNGKPIVSAPHVSEAIFRLRKAPNISIFDGELYAHKFASDFNKIISLAKKGKPTAADLAESAKLLQYHVYDMPSVPGPFSARWAKLYDVVGENNPIVKLVETVRISRMSDVEDLFGKWRGEGYEGAMIRLEGAYEQKRSKTLLKYKKMEDSEFIVVDIIEGVGNRAGMAGAVAFKTAAGKEFTASIMGNIAFFKRLLTDRKKVIGKQATVQYQNLTPDGLPRFPYVKTIRDYE
jgi:DNA ligase-1